MNNSQTTHSLRSYVLGFIFSIALTLIAYILVEQHINSGHIKFTHEFLLYAVIILAFLQVTIQLTFFLHIQKTEKSYFNLFVFTTTFTGILILVAGSLWIMNHLNTRMMPQDMTQQIIQSEGMNMSQTSL